MKKVVEKELIQFLKNTYHIRNTNYNIRMYHSEEHISLSSMKPRRKNKSTKKNWVMALVEKGKW